MFTPARQYVKDRINSSGLGENDISLLPSSCLSESYTFEDLYRELVGDNKNGEDKLEDYLVLATCLKESERLKEGHSEWCEKLEDYLSQSIFPDGKVFSLDETDDEDQSDKHHETKRLRAKYTICIIAISELLENPSNSSKPKDSTLLSLLAFENTTNPWTTSQSQQITTAILERYNIHVRSPEFLVTYVLQTFIRPTFSKIPTPKSITSTSRKAAPSSAPPRPFDVRESSPSRQPWRSNIPHTIPVLQWIIETISLDTLRTQAFPLLVPPLLTLMDSPSNSIRVHALHMVPALFSKMGDKLLLQTGLGDVFEDSIHPVLLFLPSLTPVEDTIKLLPVGYEALYALCDSRYPGKQEGEIDTRLSVSTSRTSRSIINPPKSSAQLRLAFLNRIIRQAVLPAHLHCQEIPLVVEILVSQIGIIIPKIGISGVRHLKDILPIISNILINPFLPDTSPSLIIKTLQTLRGVILVLWPRIGVEEHRLIILQALGLSYGNLRAELDGEGKSEDKKKLHEKTMKELQETGKVFVTAVRETDDESMRTAFEEELRRIIEVNEDLLRIFPRNV